MTGAEMAGTGLSPFRRHGDLRVGGGGPRTRASVAEELP
jgi:hypothetical protein